MFERIESRAGVLGGKPCIRGTRISVEFVVELAASGASRDDICRAYPQLAAEDVAESLQYAARFLENEVLLSAEIPT
jgi:uncharacterized protein (DUF433 family)